MKIGTSTAIAAAAVAVSTTLASSASAAFTEYTVVKTNFTHAGHNLTRHELFANFNGETDTVLNVFNFQAVGGWAAHESDANGFWHKDTSDGNGGVLSQTHGTWAPTLVGSASENRPFDSYMLIGGEAVTSNTTLGDPSWNHAGANPNGWHTAQLPLYDDLGWFSSLPTNEQGRVGAAGNGATTVKLGQFILNQDDTSTRLYSLRLAVVTSIPGQPAWSDGTFYLPAPSALALLGLAGLNARRRR